MAKKKAKKVIRLEIHPPFSSRTVEYFRTFQQAGRRMSVESMGLGVEYDGAGDEIVFRVTLCSEEQMAKELADRAAWEKLIYGE